MNAFLTSLLADRAKEILGVVAAHGSSHREVAMMGEYIGADYHERFLVELLQNANDQARQVGLRDAAVSVIREPGLLAVANQGEPLNEAGVKALTSLGLSQKDPNQLIGNKGIGFKAVFEVTRAPEIYSALCRGESFRAENGLRFRLSGNVFHGLEGEVLLDRLVVAALAAKPGDACCLGDGTQAAEILATELRAAAPFKFPIEIPSGEASQRFDEIGNLPADAQALVVLPLLEGEKTALAVTRAIDELVVDGGVMILFLDGIGQLQVIDRVQGLDLTFRKTRRLLRDHLADGAEHSLVSISQESGGAVGGTTEWHVMASVYGGKERPEQANALKAQVSDLPKNYHRVNRIPVKVALPRAARNPDGRICIGLPTLERTGTRAWIHSHFFGNISRKGVDLHGHLFNRLLFDEAVRLHALLITELQASADLEDRRLATSAFARSVGPLGDALFALGGPAAGSIVLRADGASFAPADRILVVAQPENAELVGKIASASSWDETGVSLPDSFLLQHVPGLLRALGEHVGNVHTEAEVLLSRGVGGLAPVEQAARAFRESGPEFWEPFLTYCLSLDKSLERLRPLAIIPVAGGRLVCANDGVFMPLPPGGLLAGSEDGEDDVPQDIFAGLPPDLARRINTVDDPGCMRLRLPDSREFTAFGRGISPGGSSLGLIRRTRLFELVNSAVIPAIERLGTTDEDFASGLRLLKLAAGLLRRMKDKSRQRVQEDRLLVPAADQTSSAGWSWAPASESYFGEGWLGGRQEKLLLGIYGERERALLVPWDKIARSQAELHRDEWRAIFDQLGVKMRPRLLSKAAADFPAPLYLRGGKLVCNDAPCPVKDGELYWREFLDVHRHRPTGVRSNGYTYTFDRVTWIDGLAPEHAAAVMELVMGDPGPYEAELTCHSVRADNPGTDRVGPLPSLWIHALRTQDWAVIPDEKGDIWRPSECWILRIPRPKRYETLHGVPAAWLNAARILQALGIEEIADPVTIDVVVRELDRVARRAQADPEPAGRSLAILAEDLYERLQRRIGSDDPKLAYSFRPSTMLPLLREGRLAGVPIREITDVFFADHLGRAAFVPDFENRLHWPFSRRRGVDGIARALRRWLGDRAEAVRLTSETRIDTGFRPAGAPKPLMDWLRENFSADFRQLRTDLGCLIAYTGLRDTDPDKATFQKHWSVFECATLIAGDFRNHPEPGLFIDTAEPGKVDIQISDSLRPDGNPGGVVAAGRSVVRGCVAVVLRKAR